MTYTELVEQAKRDILSRTYYGNSKLVFDKCNTWLNSDQINLYAYWQGYQIKNKEDGIDILLVGQDWGHNPDYDTEYLQNLDRIRNGHRVDTNRNSNNTTNNNLGEMFQYLGINIYKYDCGKRVFFTNYSLGYRPINVSESGLMTMSLMKQDQHLFEQLVEILKPKIIICLGQLVYEAVSETSTQGIWNSRLSTGVPFESKYPKSNAILVFGVPHCGVFGVKNVGGKSNMINVWKAIADKAAEIGL